MTGDLEDRLVPFTMDPPTHVIQTSELLKEENWWEVEELRVHTLPPTYEVR